MSRPVARFIRPGEMLAMDPGHIRAGAEGMFWLFGGGATPNERHGQVAVVHVRDALDHHASSYDDNYESILKRVEAAMSGADAVEAHDREHRHDEDYQPLEASPPSAVVLCIDSPGGVVSGLNECVYALRRLRAKTGVRLVAYVNELAASAAYAVACGCEAIYCPPSAIVGSIGVISTMISQARKNEKDGYDVALLTSGKCKADGHVHAPQTDAMKAREQGRVDQLAASFFKIASKARGLPVATVEGFQAEIYLGHDAERRGLVDEVLSFDDALLALQPKAESIGGPVADGNEIDRRAAAIRPAARLDATHKSLDTSRHPASNNGTYGEIQMLKLAALIKRTKASIASEEDPEKIAKLAADLAAYKKVEKHIEHHTTEEGEPDEADPNKPDPDKGDEDEEDEDEEDEKKACNEEKVPPMKKGEEEDEDEDEAKKAAASALSLIEASTGRKGPAALGAAMAMFAQLEQTRADVAKLKASALTAERDALLKRAARYVPKHLVSALKTQKLAAIRAFVSEAEKGQPMVATDEGDLIKPQASQPGTEASLPKETLAMIDQAVNCSGEGVDKKALRAALVSANLESHTKQLTAALGSAGRI